MTGQVTADLADGVGLLEFGATEPNFLNPELLEGLAEAAASLNDDLRCRAIVLCSTGRHFSAGADFGENGIGADRPAAARQLYGAAARLFDLSVPVVAVVQGAAVGAGLGLACAADFRVAGPASRFHANFTQLGFHPGFGLTHTLPEIVGMQAATELLYSGRRIGGAEAAGIGLVDRLVADDELRSAACSWADELAQAAPLAVRALKRTLRASRGAAVRTAMETELAEQTWLWSTDDCRIGLEAAAARRRPTFTGR